MKNLVKKVDIVARVGGDEFVMLLKGEFTDNVLTKIAQKLNINLAEPYNLFDIQYTCKASIGVALYPKDALNKDGLIKAD
ncbi:diguanylate cyclase domain-containing protein [Psychromonas sp. KJ10-10]|uniref:diguanylate cyclase domain-containing protein n=1 Tax=Psychromonas sp. KJ10-10 TaxID=3391823 RepID=UPI0039B6A2B1